MFERNNNFKNNYQNTLRQRNRNKQGLAYFNIECKKITIERLDL